MLPDYKRSILSITSSVARFFGSETPYPPLDEVTNALYEKDTKNVVLLLFDGMGENLLKRHLPEDSFLRKHDICAISTVFPSTTTAATTSLWTGIAPGEHGWLGWSLYFKEIGRQIDTFLSRDSFTGERYHALTPSEAYIPFETIYPSVNAVSETHALFPFPTSATKGARDRRTYSGMADLKKIILECTKKEGKQLICAYVLEPDHTMHECGVSHDMTKKAFSSANDVCASLSRLLSKDTLLIVTADHGLVDVKENIRINEIPSLMDCLLMPPSIEGRAASLFVKPHKKDEFKNEFLRLYGDDFFLFSHDEVMDMHLLGLFPPHKKTDDFLGDFFACAKGNKSIQFMTPASSAGPDMIGQHAGLTEDEMLVPLILARGEA